MKSFFKKYFIVLLIFALSGLVGGYLAGLDLFDSYPPEIQEQIMSAGMDKNTLTLITAVQYAGYGFFLGIFGIILSKKIGLWNDELSIEFKPMVSALSIAAIGGVSMIAFDILWFGKIIQPIADSYLVKPNLPTIIGTVLLGGIVEEVMLRLFVMSLLAFILLKLFRNSENTDAIFAVANIVSALLFAAAHLPATQVLFGLTPLILFRCFLLNGGLGLLFGRLYRKHGIQYAMIAHAGCHVISKLIWIFFI